MLIISLFSFRVFFNFLRFFPFFKPHSSFWYSRPRDYSLLVKEDIFIREFINKNFFESIVSHIEIKRRLNFLFLNIHVVKPKLIKLYDLRNKLMELLSANFVSRDITINILEIVNPDLNPRILAHFIRQQLEKRLDFRRVMKTAILKAQKAGAKGVKVQIAGRLNGAEIARTEWAREGQVPLHTLKANIDYCSYKALVIFVYLWFYS